jgi:uncharacterized cupin superfamily protein
LVVSKSIITAAPATVELDLMPMNPDWILEGAPCTRAKVLAVSQDGAICIMAWDCSAGRFKWLYSEDEIAHIISGAVVITDERGEEQRLNPGDTAFFPAGSTSTWHVPAHVRKLAVLHHAIPVSLSFALRALRRVRRSLPTNTFLRSQVGPAKDDGPRLQKEWLRK